MTAPTFTMSGGVAGMIYYTRGGSYTADSSGNVTAVKQADVRDLLNDGLVVSAGTSVLQQNQVQAANGLVPTALRLDDFKNTDGSSLAAAAAAGKFGHAITLATNHRLVGEAAQNNTKTDDAIQEFVLPPWYVAGKDLTVTVHASLTGTGVAGTKNVQIKAFKTATDGTQGADLGPGASAITAAGADVTFLITGATLNPGNKVVLQLEAVLQETGNLATITAQVNSVRVS